MFDDTGSRVHSQVRISQYRLLDSGTLTLVDIADIERVNATLSEFVYENSWSNEVVYPSKPKMIQLLYCVTCSSTTINTLTSCS